MNGYWYLSLFTQNEHTNNDSNDTLKSNVHNKIASSKSLNLGGTDESLEISHNKIKNIKHLYILFYIRINAT